MDTQDQIGKYLRRLPKSWEPNYYPDMDTAMQWKNAMHQDQYVRDFADQWSKTPKVVVTPEGAVPVDPTTGVGQVPDAQQRAEARKKLDERMAEASQRIRDLKQKTEASELDPYAVLGLAQNATSQQLYAATEVACAQCSAGEDHWDRMLDRLREEKKIGTWDWVDALWNLEIFQIARERVDAAHDQLSKTIGSEDPPARKRGFFRLFG